MQHVLIAHAFETEYFYTFLFINQFYSIISVIIYISTYTLLNYHSFKKMLVEKLIKRKFPRPL